MWLFRSTRAATEVKSWWNGSTREKADDEGIEVGQVLAATLNAPYIGFASVRSEAEAAETEIGGHVDVIALNEVIG